MKSLRVVLLSTVAVIALEGAASAQDMSYKSNPTVYSWTGGYIGANVGVAHLDGTCGPTAASYGYYLTCGSYYGNANTTINATSIAGGAQAGYDWQSGSFVYGVAADWSWTGLRGTAYGSDFGYYEAKANVDWLASVRGRAGLAVDKTMVYFTGGLALGGVHGDFIYGGTSYGTVSKVNVGWVAGLGLEHRFTPNWSAFAEALYYDLGSVKGGMYTYSVETYQNQYYFQVMEARVGLNYRF